MVDSIIRLDVKGTLARFQEPDPQDILNKLQSILSSCRGGNAMLVDQTKDRLATGMQANHNDPVAPNTQMSEGRGNEESRERIDQRSHTDLAATFTSDPEAQQSEDRALRFMSVSAPDTANLTSPDFSSQQQGFLPNSWNYMAEDTQLEFNGDFEQNNPSVTLDRLLGNTMGDSVRVMRESNILLAADS